MQVWSSWVWSRLPTPKPGEGLAAEPGILARSPNEWPLPRKGAPGHRITKPCSGKGREDATEGACRGLSGAVSPQGQGGHAGRFGGDLASVCAGGGSCIPFLVAWPGVKPWQDPRQTQVFWSLVARTWASVEAP